MTMYDSAYYSRVLSEHPTPNPPYLSSRGYHFAMVPIIAALLAMITFFLNNTDAAAFLAACTASASFLLAVCHSFANILWRSVKNGVITCKVLPSVTTIQENSDFSTTVVIQNPLPIAVNIHAIRWNHTDHIMIPEQHDDDIFIPAHSEKSLVFKAHTFRAGRAAIQGLGMLIDSPLGLFLAEEHKMMQLNLDVVPAGFVNQSLKKLPKKLAKAIAAQSQTPNPDADIETIRPYQNSDKLKNIAWRYYAKTNQLNAWKRSSEDARHLICLIDAGPQMRLIRKDYKTCLGNALTIAAQCADSFTTTTVIVYNEFGAHTVVSGSKPTTLTQALKTYLLDALQWQPPATGTTNADSVWATAAYQLMSDFRLYRHVDFTKDTPKGKIIDLRGLVKYAISDDALHYIKSDPEKAAQIMQTPYINALLKLVRERCHFPANTLPPVTPTSKLDNAIPILNQHQTAAQSSLIWISDFASPASFTGLQELSRFITTHKTPAVGVCMPMPDHALNFVHKQGLQYRAEVAMMMRGKVDFYDE